MHPLRHPLRSRFSKEIIAEFLPPYTSKALKRGRVIVLCSGLPSMPSKAHVLEFLSHKGFWAFSPRYRGTWESEGEFMQVSPEKDIKDVVDGLSKPIIDIVSKKKLRVRAKEIIIIGSSFGGPAALLLSKDKRVRKVITFSPVVDWKVHIKNGETIDGEMNFIKEAFGGAHRFKKENWQRLKTGTFYNPAHSTRSIDGKKILIFQAKDDKSVPWRSVKKFAEKVGAKLMLKKKGGHFGFSEMQKPRFHKPIYRFLKA